MTTPADSLTAHSDYWVGRFGAMACSNEILLDVDSRHLAESLFELATREARRIERKFSRYRDDNIIYHINHAAGQPVRVDEETANLLDYARNCHQLSDGLFDITSGILRRAWQFDGSDQLPEAALIADLLPMIGWQRVRWRRPYLTLPAGMEIDLGGLGKEYAVDRCVQILQRLSDCPKLVNFGGDLFVTRARRDGTAWTVGIDNPATPGSACVGHIHLRHGALATSGDARRYLMKDGIRYSHILNPMTGWPVVNAPHAVSVVADTCLQAGMLSTLALLHGERAEAFLQSQQVPYWAALANDN